MWGWPGSRPCWPRPTAYRWPTTWNAELANGADAARRDRRPRCTTRRTGDAAFGPGGRVRRQRDRAGGAGQRAVRAVSSGQYSNLADAETAVDCLDRPWRRSWRPGGRPRRPPAGPRRCSARRSCGAAWPAQTGGAVELLPQSAARIRRPAALGAGAPPILVVGNLRDPADAVPVGAGAVLGPGVRRAAGPRMAERHTAYMMGSSCVNDVVKIYLIRWLCRATAPIRR